MSLFPTVIIGLIVAILTPSLESAVIRHCTEDERCIQIAQCGKFYNYVNEAPKFWPPSVRQDAIRRLCATQLSVNGSKIYYVCCGHLEVTCGLSRLERIAFGNVATPLAFPWMVLLQSTVAEEFPCGGSLISDRHVLTAAHCVKLRQIVAVRAGEHDIGADSDCSQDATDDDGGAECVQLHQDIPIGQITIHPKYSARLKQNDLAIIELQFPAIFNYAVMPICLPVTDELRANPSTNAIVAGWGVTETGERSAILRYATLPTIPLPECALLIKELNRVIALDDGHLCAGGTTLSAHCNGDSGGPLQYISISSRFVLQGVISFGLKSCGKKVAPGVFANITHHLDWIVLEMNQMR